MKLDFDGLEIQNFRSFVGEASYIPLGKAGVGLHFIRGRNEYQPELDPNGAGKSSIWMALSWCLDGTTQAGLRNPDIRPWFGDPKAATIVTVLFRVDGKKHEITRTAAPNLLSIDGVEASQDQVYRLIGLLPQTRDHTILLGQGRPLFFDLKPKEKMDLFGSVLDLDRWVDWSKVADDQVDVFKKKEQALGLEMALAVNQSGETQRQLDALRAQSEEWEQARLGRVDTSSASLKKLEKDRVPILKKRDKADLDYDGAGMELKLIRADLGKARKALTAVQTAYTAKQQRLDLLEEQIAELNKLKKAKRCPTCDQPITAQHLKAHEQVIDDRIDAIDATNEEKALKKAEILVARLEGAEDAFVAKELDAGDALVTLNKQIAEIDAAIYQIKKARKEKEEESNPFRVQIVANQKLKKAIATSLTDIAKDQDKVKQAMARYSYWVKGFKDVRLYVIEEVLQELELTTNAMLPDFGLDGWEVRYDIEKETKSGSIAHGLNVSILSPDNDKPVRWEVWCGGESQRLRLVGALALGQVLLNHAGIECNLEVLDEPTRGLSINGVRGLCNHLSDRAYDLGKTIYFIDHIARDSSRFDSITTVVRDKKGSYIQ